MDLRPIDSLKYPRYAGIRTFFRLPHVEDPTGLDVAIFGVPHDGGQSYRTGSRFAPSEIRSVSVGIKPYHPPLGICPYDYLKVADLGDSPVNPLDPSMSRDDIQRFAERVINAGALSMAIGGDHSITLPLLRAVARKHGPVGLIQVDSHLDTSDTFLGSKYGGGTPFRRAVEEKLIDPSKWVQIGIRGSAYHEHYFEFVREHNVRCLTMDQIYGKGFKWVLQQLDYLRNEKVYVTYDIDGMDAAYAPGTTNPMPGGIISIEGQVLLRYLKAFPNIVGFDLVEVQPAYDVGSMTSILAATLMFEFLATRAVVRRESLAKVGKPARIEGATTRKGSSRAERSSR